MPLGASMENPYQSPPESGTESVATEVVRTQTFAAAAILGIQVAIKWVAIIIAPILVLTLLYVLGWFVYRGIWQNDWSNFVESEKRWRFVRLIGLSFAAYIIACFWGSLFGGGAYSIRHALTRNVGKRQCGSEIAGQPSDAPEPPNRAF